MTLSHTAAPESQMLSQAATAPGRDSAVALNPALADLARRLAARGATLLRNAGDVLPLGAGARVAVLGRVQLDWICVGYGSGGDVNPPYVTNLLDSLVEEGVDVDADLADAYRSWCAEHPVDPGTVWGQWPLSYPEMPVEDDAIRAAAQRCPTAVVVLGRAAGEDRESALLPGSYYLTDDERRLLERATAAFDRTIVVVATGNVLDLAWAEELAVDGLLLAWCGGMEGGRAAAQVLTGSLEPGGRLSDTIARRYEDYPSSQHFGDPVANDYAEDIYVGYRYFETFDHASVQYPFGFGLGYSSHEIEADEPQVGAEATTVRATVRNTGSRPSSAVVQLYARKARGPLDSPERELVAFARTAEVGPGASQEVTLAVPLRALASYDDSGATGHAFAWVVQAGVHDLYLGADVRSATRIGGISIPETIVLEQLEQAAAPEAEHAFERIANRPGDDGRPHAVGELVPVSRVDLRQRILSRLPDELERAQGRVAFDQVMTGDATPQEMAASMEPEDLARLAYGDTTMDSPLGPAGNAGALGGVSQRLRALGVPPAITTDGPSGIRLSAYASLLPCGTALACTWDPAAVRELAALHGRELISLGSDILLSPGMNIHRDPLCGRNFEYFSEDPLLTGALGAAVVDGLQSTGRSACPKHFAANNQETNRIHVDSRVSERALREIYLRGFETVVRSSHPDLLMTSYNKVNGVWAHYHYDLVTTILRGEWGFEGLVVTDWWMRMAPDPLFPALRDSAYRVRAGVDVLMPGSAEHAGTEREDAVLESYREPDGGLTLAEMQQTAVHVLRYLRHHALAASH